MLSWLQTSSRSTSRIGRRRSDLKVERGQRRSPQAGITTGLSMWKAMTWWDSSMSGQWRPRRAVLWENEMTSEVCQRWESEGQSEANRG